MKIFKTWGFLLFIIMVLCQSCQRNEGNTYLIVQAIPFPGGASDKRLYVDQPDPDYRNYVVYARCEIDSKKADLFLAEIGFGPNEMGLTTRLPQDDLPEKIVSWWRPPAHDATLLKSKRLGTTGYAQALVAEGKLYLFAIGDTAFLKR